MAAPVLAAYVSRRLNLTRQNDGDVLLTNLPIVGASTGITSWAFTASSGNTSEWTTYTDGRHPTPTGTSGVSTGNSVWNVTATNPDGTSSAVTFTITVPVSPAGYTAARRDKLATINPGGDANASRINDRRVELARGAHDFGLAIKGGQNGGTTLGVIQFRDWRCSGSSRCVIQHEDPDNPCDLGRITIRGSRNLDFDSLRINTARRASPNLGESAWVVSNYLTYSTEGLRFLDTYNSPGHDGVNTDSGQNINSLIFQPGTGVGNSVQCEFNNWESYGLAKAFGWAGDPTKHYEITWNGRTVVRYYSISAVAVTAHDATSTFHFDWLLGMSPLRDTVKPASHTDTVQVNQGTLVYNLTIDKFWMIQADGTGRATQAFFANETPGTLNPPPTKMTVGQAVICHNAFTGFLVTSANADYPISVQNMTLMRQMSGPWGKVRASHGLPPLPNGETNLDAPVLYYPRVELKEWVEAAGFSMERVFSYANVKTASDVVFSETVYSHLSGSPTDANLLAAADVSEWFPAADWICSPQLLGYLNDNVEVVDYLGVDDVRWHGTVDEVITHITTALTPTVSGPAILSDGRVIGAFFPDGTDNDGSVFGDPAPGPTTYTISSVAQATVGDVVPFTVTMNNPALVETTFTFTPTGVAGTLSSSTAVVPVGQISGSVTFTPSGGGSLSMAVADNRGLTDPSARVVAVSAPTPPSSYARAVNPRRVAVGRPVAITATLDRVATDDPITVSIAVTGLAGVLSASEIVIGVGETSGAVTFTPSAAGTATVSTTNDADFSDPDDTTLIAFSGSVSRGSLRRLLKVSV